MVVQVDHWNDIFQQQCVLVYYFKITAIQIQDKFPGWIPFAYNIVLVDETRRGVELIS